MILIVAHHFSVHGGFEFSTSEITINRLWIQLIGMGGKIGVNIFVLISGYFLINSSSNKISKILKLWMQIFTYSITIAIIFGITKIEPFGIKELIKHILPITYSEWWFASTYFVLYLIYPYLNKLLISLDRQTYQKLIILTTILWCLVPTFLKSNFQSNNLIWFIYLYALAGYIRIHITDLKFSSKKFILIALIFTILTFGTVIILDFIGIRVNFLGKHATYFCFGMQRLPMLLIAFFIFLGFLKIKIKSNKIINTIASATFGVYLIHDSEYMRKFLWKIVFKNASFSNSAILIPYSIGVIFLVFYVCTLIELFRIFVIERCYKNKIDDISKWIEKYIDKFLGLKIFK